MELKTFVLALAIGLIAVPVTWLVLRSLRMMDVPNERSSHSRLVPRGAGVGVAMAATIAVAVAEVGSPAIAVATAALALGVVGLVDDMRGLSARVRLGFQFAVPALTLPFVIDDWWSDLPWVVPFAIGSVAWCAAYVNAYNFMDGINGIAVAQATIAGVAFAVIGNRYGDELLSAAGIAIAGAMASFAPFNFPVARLFLGDVGSYFAGTWLALLLVLAVREGVPVEVAVAPFVIYLVDTSTTLVRRWRRGQPLSVAHHEHAYQQLVDRGWSHVVVTGMFAALTILGVALMMVIEGTSAGVRATGFLAVVVLAAGFVKLPTLLAHRQAAAAR